MGLNDIAHGIGEVTSRRDIENFTASESQWKWLLAHDPYWASTFVDYSEPEEIKMFVELFDDILLNGPEEGDLSESQRDEIEQIRKELVDEL